MRPAARCLPLLVAACAATKPSVNVGTEIEAHLGHSLERQRLPEDPTSLPEGVRVDDGLSQDEAVAIAIWNSPRLRADLTTIAIAEGNVADARRPSNPTLRFLFPSGPQQLSVLLTWPIENLAFMRRRIRVANAELEVATHRAVQLAIDLARDASLAHVEWQLAIERLRARQVVAAQAHEIAVIAEARGTAGDVAPRDGDAARIDAQVANDEATRAEADVAIARSKIDAVMGWASASPSLHPQDSRPPTVPVLTEDLEGIALESRPDLRASQLAIEAAGARLGLERVVVLKFAGVGQAVGKSITGGVQAELPIFNQNQGGIARARAELEGAKWRYHDLRRQIVAEVAQGKVQHDRAVASLKRYRDTIVLARERDMAVITKVYDAGEIDYSGVLVVAQQLQAARLREVEYAAEVRRSRAALERALGRRLASLHAKATP